MSHQRQFQLDFLLGSGSSRAPNAVSQSANVTTCYFKRHSICFAECVGAGIVHVHPMSCESSVRRRRKHNHSVMAVCVFCALGLHFQNRVIDYGRTGIPQTPPPHKHAHAPVSNHRFSREMPSMSYVSIAPQMCEGLGGGSTRVVYPLFLSIKHS